MSQNKIITIVGIILLVGAGFLFFNSRTLEVQPDQAMPDDTPNNNIPAEWRTYTNPNLGFSIKYDPALEMDEDQEGARWYQWGPTQSEGTEVYDGFIVSLSKTEYSGSLDDYIIQQVQMFTEVGEILSPLVDVTINGIPGKSFKGSSLGEYTITFLPVNNSNVLVISSMAPDPGNIGFQTKIDKMLSTLQIIQ